MDMAMFMGMGWAPLVMGGMSGMGGMAGMGGAISHASRQVHEQASQGLL